MANAETQLAWPLIGNQKAVDFLTKSLASRRLAHAYIFTGPADLGKNTIAYCFAKNLLYLDSATRVDLDHLDPAKLSLSGDFHVISRETDKKNISIAQIREFIKILEMSSFANSYKIGIIKEAELLSDEAANALLKLLEEPQPKVVIILITSQLEAILPTLRSRSQVINFYPVKTEAIHDYLIKERHASPSAAKRCARLALGRPALAIKFLEDADFYNDYLRQVEVFLNFFEEDLLQRLAAVDELWAEKKNSEEGAPGAARILEIWVGLVRDLLLLNLSDDELIQNWEVKDKLQAIKESRPAGPLKKLMKILETGKKYLSANVSPKNVLEQVAVNI